MKGPWTLFFWLCLTSAAAQVFEPSAVNLTVQDGLAGDNVYCALQDQEGYLWFGTETGVSRYNGRTFKNFYTSDGLPDNEIFRIDQDSRGRIWFSAFNGKPGYYHNGRFYNADNDSLLAQLQPKSYYVNLMEDSDHNLWFAYRWGVGLITAAGEVFTEEDFSDYDRGRIASFREHEGEIWGGSVHLETEYLLFKDGSIPNQEYIRTGHDFNHKAHLLGNEAYLSGDRPFEIFKFFNRFIEPGFVKERSSKVHDYGDSLLWICTFNGALSVDLRKQEVRRLFHKKQVSHVLKDSEGGYWTTTLGEGIFYVPHLSNTSIQRVNGEDIGNITALNYINGKLWFGGNNALVGYADDATSVITYFAKREGRSRVKKIMSGTWPGDIIVVAEEALILKNNKNQFQRLIGSVKSLSKWGEKYYVAGTHAVLYVMDAPGLYKSFEKNTVRPDRNDYSMFFDENIVQRIPGLASVIDIEQYKGGLLISSSHGLHYLDEQFNYTEMTGHPIMKEIINDVLVLNDSTYLLATGGNGTFLNQAGEWIHFSVEMGMASAINRKVFPENDSTFWIATNAGINKVVLSHEEMVISHIGSTEGLMSEDVNDLLIVEDQLIAATSKGISRIDLSNLKEDDLAPSIKMKGIAVDGAPWSENEEIAYGPSAITVHYDGLHYRSRGALSYQYRLEGFDDTWRVTNQNSVTYSGLRSGDYTFQLKANSAKGKSSEVIHRSFVIATPYWATGWFIVLAALLVLLTGYWLIGQIIRRNRLKEQKKYELQLKIAEAERKALQSQLNPHFIFNSLNSIQNMVLDNNIEEVYQYLAKFGKLIRRVLEFSDISLISLADELETLRIYMELENLRLNDKFDFTIELAKGTDPMTEIPSMILQPHVENAIWHGITPLKGKRRGQVMVSASETEVGLHLEVVDNGVGRQVKVDSSLSFGTKIVNELVRKQKGRRSGQVEIVDLYEGGEPAGTKVMIQFLPELST